MIPRILVAIVAGGSVLAALAYERLNPADLVVLCSNNVESCESVVAAYSRSTGAEVTLVRMPTSEALARIRMPKQEREFDVWMGGPADAYAIAANEGLLAAAEIDDESNIPDNLRDPDGRWFGIYGGILAFCVGSDDHAPRTWADLVAADAGERIVIPNPMTSGTAFTMLSVQYERLGSFDETMTYMEALDDRAATYTDSGTVPAHVVASGRASIGVTFAPYCETERLRGYDVRTVYPQDGTGFEVGAIAILREASASEEALTFLNFTASDEGQELGAQAARQLPVSDQLDTNLNQSLDALDIVIYGRDIEAAGARRTGLISTWANRVRNGAY